jgi:flagellar basal body P-ring formation protein FlgA
MMGRESAVTRMIMLLVAGWMLGTAALPAAESIAGPVTAGPRDGVREAEVVIEPEELGRIIETHLRRRVDPGLRIEVNDIRTAERVVRPSGAFSHDVLLPEQAGRGGQISFTVSFSVNGREVKRIRVSARVDLYADVVVAGGYLKKHQEIREGDVHRIVRNVAQLPPDVVREIDEVVGKRMTLSINGQEVLRKGMVEVPPVVKKGDRVIMVVENDVFKITSWGELKEDGRRGERVRLVNLASKKEVMGRVINAAAVQVEY